MNTTAIIVILVGIVIFVVSFLIPVGNEDPDSDLYEVSQEEIHKAVAAEAERGRIRMEEVVDETVTYAIEKAERAMERVSNEKIMAIGEYSDTVLKDIDKNHKEVAFLYDMLNDKHDNLQETVKVAQQAATDARQASEDAQQSTSEAYQATQEVQQALRATEETTEEKVSMTADELLDAIDEVAVEERPAEEFHAFEPPKVEVVPKKSTKKTSSRKKAASSGEKADAAEASAKAVDPEKIPQLQFSTGDEESDNLGRANNNDRILEMHRAGKSNMAIAKALGLGMGEVKLVIDLYQKGIKG